VADLDAKSPGAGLLPLTIGQVTASEEALGAMTSLTPYKGRAKDLSGALKTAHGMAFPAAGRATGKAGARAIWFSHGQAILQGPAPDAALAEHAALTDQSDAWVVVRLEGKGAVDVLARLMPLDLRPSVFKRGHTARTELLHMAASVTKTGENAFQIMVFRSMAKTLVHDLKTAMEGVATRG
jgi:heterotetrameric sarcosine oxidase gamma subunit